MIDTVVAATPVALASIQSDLSVKPLSQIEVLVISQDQKPTLDSKVRLQALAAIGAVGIALTIIFTGLIDGLLRSRRRRLDEAARLRAAEIEASEYPEDATDPAADQQLDEFAGHEDEDIDSAPSPSRRQ